jgi:hypothetical protein
MEHPLVYEHLSYPSSCKRKKKQRKKKVIPWKESRGDLGPLSARGCRGGVKEELPGSVDAGAKGR